MNIDEAAQYLGYRDVEHLQMQDLSEYHKWWELIKKLTSKDETELNLHLVSGSFNVGDDIIVCDDLITVVTKIEGDKVYFFDEWKKEMWDIKEVIKHYSC